MRDAGQGVVGPPMIVHDGADETSQRAAALAGDAVKAQPRGAGDVQPLRLSADAEARLVEMLDRGADDVVAHRLGEALEAPRRVLADVGDGRAGEMDAE